ncbi:Crinkler effector protein 4 [Phytophthora oleae]|uniref:Crinkler effector protein 4 n=1 Tax=Phytophthora oleae TaxID=2107226 RepID=A0ABD3F5B6_9STRA
MVKLSLMCAIVGKAGSVFGVEIDDGEQVWKLKEMIKNKEPDTIKGEADRLQLFLAKESDTWLLEKDLVTLLLYDGEIHPDSRR